MRIVLTVSLLCVTLLVAAQDKLRFNSRNFIGLLEGERGSAFQLQTVNGISFKRYFAGLGTGLDYYGSRSVPAFLSLSADVRRQPRTFFVTANAGLNFSWKPENFSQLSTINIKNNPGLYGSAHLGYRVQSKNRKDGFMLSLGYSYKHHRETHEIRQFCINPPCQLTKEYMDYYFRRISVLLGWQF